MDKKYKCPDCKKYSVAFVERNARDLVSLSKYCCAICGKDIFVWKFNKKEVKNDNKNGL